MKDNDIKILFSEVNTPSIDADKKKQAIALAMREFSQQQEENKNTEEKQKNNQGYWFIPRPIKVFFTNYRQNMMTTLNNKLFYSGFATLSIAVIGTVLFQQSQQANVAATPTTLNESTGKAEPQVLAAAPAKERKKFEQSLDSISESVAIQEFSGAKRSTIPASKSIPNARAEIALSDESHSNSSQTVGRDRFESVKTNSIQRTAENSVSTFSIDVDTTSYSFTRRQLNHGVLPQKSAIRSEEFINYFDYNYPLPTTQEQPFEPTIATYASPWNKGKKLIHIGIKGYDIEKSAQPRSNLILLLDVSGSMNNPDKLPLVKQSMDLLLTSLNPDDTIGIVVYAGAVGAVLEPTPVREKQKIIDALRRLNAGGSTAGAQGIKLAYQLAEANFDKNAVNRIMLATDGDFNVGITNQDELKGFIERKRDKGIFLSVLGFGQGNYNDQLMQTLAQNGNGVAAYIDSLSEAQKVLIDQATSTLFPIAKDVKIQVEFNPDTVSEYRLVGYETRQLAREDFNNDKVDAGDIGAGHSVTAIYEITPVKTSIKPSVDPLRYQESEPKKTVSYNQEYGFLKIRYKLPNEDTSRLISKPIPQADTKQETALDNDIKFASAVAGFSQLLQGGEHIHNYHYDDVIQDAQANKGEDPFGYRAEFIQLVRKAKVANALP